MVNLFRNAFTAPWNARVKCGRKLPSVRALGEGLFSGGIMAYAYLSTTPPKLQTSFEMISAFLLVLLPVSVISYLWAKFSTPVPASIPAQVSAPEIVPASVPTPISVPESVPAANVIAENAETELAELEGRILSLSVAAGRKTAELRAGLKEIFEGHPEKAAKLIPLVGEWDLFDGVLTASRRALIIKVLEEIAQKVNAGN